MRVHFLFCVWCRRYRAQLTFLRRALRAGIRKQQIVLDPGIGFGKSAPQNFEILQNLPRLTRLGYPLLIGVSRKSFIRHTLQDLLTGPPAAKNVSKTVKALELIPEELLYGTAAAVTAAILNGAHIVRVHDVRQIVAVARVADQILS